MTRKERAFAIYRFFVKHSWRIFVVFSLLIVLLYVLLNFGTFLGGFLRKVTNIVSSRRSSAVTTSVSGSVPSSDVSVSSVPASSVPSESPSVSVSVPVPVLPVVYIIDDSSLVTDFGVFDVGLSIPPWKLLDYEKSSRVAVWEHLDSGFVFRSCVVPLRLPVKKE